MLSIKKFSTGHLPTHLYWIYLWMRCMPLPRVLPGVQVLDWLYLILKHARIASVDCQTSFGTNKVLVLFRKLIKLNFHCICNKLIWFKILKIQKRLCSLKYFPLAPFTQPPFHAINFYQFLGPCRENILYTSKYAFILYTSKYVYFKNPFE